ncbi:MAG: Hsp20/alpha crystallin family protein [Nitrosopumilus sp.]|nr:Hsp20/alpha crystallin family protein [Nitrosopumilus sp.]MDH3736725.1 Hsp20/alpha crystallin family protein [Nitrosopumilus sp.]MDH3822210.1 Hsp20/alpha crystallin family protein [Nitrosopumilus sp.]MDH3834009.1 Hsp20/alpha crystallin family protein [Nitrosopumilus sp.]
MTMFFDSEFDRIFKRMSNSFFNIDDIFEEFKGNGSASGPFYYGYTMTVGPDGKPVVKEYGNVKPGLLPTSDTREPIVDTIVDEKVKVVKLIAEMPGVEKTDVKIVVENKTVNLSAEHDEKKYHVRVPLKHKVDENSAKASYKNGILQLVFKLVEEKAKGKTVEVE